MNSIQIIILAVLASLICAMIFFIFKYIFLPKKSDVLPKLLKSGKTQSLIKQPNKL